jgi:uncharacterized protein
VHETRATHLNEALEHFVEVVSALPSVHSIRVFGSVANGTVGEWSDLDVAVVMDTDLPFRQRATSLKLLTGTVTSMDLVVYTPSEWARAPVDRPFVYQEISQQGRVLS